MLSQTWSLRTQVRGGIHLVWIDHGRASIVDSDPVFPPPNALKGPGGAHHSALALLLSPDDEAPAGNGTGVARATDRATGLESVVAPIVDADGAFVAALLLVPVTPAASSGAREVELLIDYAARLRPLIV